MAWNNEVRIIGNLGRDPELTETKAGAPTVKVGVATNHRRGEGHEDETVWHNVHLYGSSAENFARICSKGGMVFMIGRVFYAEYEGRDGTQKREARINVSNWQWLGFREGREKGEPSNGRRKPDEWAHGIQAPAHSLKVADDEFAEDDLPF